MALFEDEPFDPEEEAGNSYLKDPVKGLELVRTILRRQKDQKSGNKEILRKEIPALLAGLELEAEAEFYQRLSRLSGRIKEQERVALLDGKVVLGVGGRFSAGKSCFINSITNARLPEEQRETTSISTYVIQADTKTNVALTAGGSSIPLDDEAIQALTHEFYSTYHIGFSRVIQNLAICSPEFQYPNIAILDTPGYNKADTGKMKEATDAENARRQLDSVDYLIWLVDIENGELKADDEKFIDSLNVSTPILIVFNKAGTVLPEKAEAVVANTASRLKESGRNIFKVIAYDSWGKKTVVGGDALERFLDMVNRDSKRSRGLGEQLEELSQDICDSIEKQLKKIRIQRDIMDKAITNSRDAKGLGALISAYVACGRQKQALLDAKKSIQSAFKAVNEKRSRANGQQ